ncbi:MAG TPA: FRG domain-containing protein [Bryobacteraceae bacterium]|nr:FRG domain-containing protein [Bryobacteraceae bacterium]
MKRTPRICVSVSQFIDSVVGVREKWFDSDDAWGPLFRGQKKASWSLCPNLYRYYGTLDELESNQVEDEIREEFAVRAPILSETRIAADPWGLYFLMQHFGAPTRLLDWTEGALIALYFAVRDNPGLYDAAVWALDPYGLKKRAIHREEIYAPNEPGLPARDKKRVAPWLPLRFSSSKIPRQPIAVYPTHTARRMSNQRACFTVHGSDPNGLDCLEGTCLMKIIIPSSKVLSIKRELETTGIDEATIFPDLDGLGRTVCNRWKVNSLSPPHANVYTRLRPSSIHGVGVFAIRRIGKGTRLFLGDNDEMHWIKPTNFHRLPKEVRKLYEDFAVLSEGRYGCPENFNRLTMSWYLNEPVRGKSPNVECLKDSYDFAALRDISVGEELTVDYATFSELSAETR